MFTDLALRGLIAFQGLRARMTREDGQTLAEYGLIMAVIAVAVIVLAGIAFRGAIVASFDSSRECLLNSPACT